jgi:uncharacterized surface protein with fasciclin (FAS1) repeats
MRLLHLLPLASLAASIVLPDEQILAELAPEGHHRQKPDAHGSLLEGLKHGFADLKEKVDEAIDAGKRYFDEALAAASEADHQLSQKFQDTVFDVEGWLEDPPFEQYMGRGPPVDGPHNPHHPPGKGPHPPHRKPGHKRPHKGHHGHHKSNLTIYQLISESKYTTKLAKLVDEDQELVDVLNSTKANFTLFAPTDRAFAKIPKHAPKPSKELIRKVLLYHIADGLYPAGRVLHSHTIPSLYNETALGKNSPQRLVVKVGLKGLTINYFSRVVAVNIVRPPYTTAANTFANTTQFAKNGVIHGVDSIILPPPDVLTIINFFPGEFSTLTLGLTKTGLLDVLNETTHTGSTFFAPSNFAFRKLGPKINGFLFSKYGEKYLKALLQYHVVHNETLYSDAFYSSDSTDTTSEPTYNILEMAEPWKHQCARSPSASKKDEDEAKATGNYHFDLPTLLDDRSIAVDIARFGPFITIKINGFTRVAVQDGVAKDGVIHIVSDVLIPPKKLGGAGEKDEGLWMGEEMSVEEFKERLGPFMEEDDKVVDGDEEEEEWKDL